MFDSTYKMNRYGMSFVPFVGVNNHRCTTVFGCAIIADETEGTYVWLLQTFMKANCQVKPKSIITYGDAAMMAQPNTMVQRWLLTPTKGTNGIPYLFILYVLSNTTTSP